MDLLRNRPQNNNPKVLVNLPRTSEERDMRVRGMADRKNPTSQKTNGST